MNEKGIIDIEDWNKEFISLNDRFELLQNRFLAIAMDYKYYIDSSWGENEIYQLRDDISFRLFCSKFHIELLLKHHIEIKHRLHERFKKDPSYFSRQYFGANPLYEHYGKEVSSIFDSIVYHAVSSFDYLAVLCNYICGAKKSDKLKWTQLARSVRDKKNIFSTTEIANPITEIDREFVGKLYNHRSHVIHKKSDQNKYSITMSFGQTKLEFIPKFFIGNNLIKEFNHFRELNKSNNITDVYASFWIINQVVEKITDILFSLKKHMELNPKQNDGHIFNLDKDTSTKKPVSESYWKENEYKK
ncbi:hypothetical protein [Constantimarinum furrinae]|uniref:Cthe-2314-like HEPN domain-containing protein n=1 Tax=Constantimarinum furrinae TaxID=2562285 RepID=A0A7G8PXM9_9FLAO|nr:hypothetical protein [Constantimarinum furrinae]QNJ99095.1 hypothetical protein ALE3EI_2563 [Constantimarinum furrinae]